MSAAAVHQVLVSLCLSKLGCHEFMFHINNNSDAFHELSEALELSRVWLFSYKQCMLTKRKKPILSDLPQHINFFKRWLPWEFNSFPLCHLSPWMMTTSPYQTFQKKSWIHPKTKLCTKFTFQEGFELWCVHKFILLTAPLLIHFCQQPSLKTF